MIGDAGADADAVEPRLYAWLRLNYALIIRPKYESIERSYHINER